MAHVLETLQINCKDLEKKLKDSYGKNLGRQLIVSAGESVDYSYQAERNTEWWINYRRELENRL